MLKLLDADIKDIESYCKLNKIDNVDKFSYDCFKDGFNIKKYGMFPGDRQIQVKEIPVEVIKEVMIEKIVKSEEDENNLKECQKKLEMITQTLQTLRNEMFIKDNKLKEFEKK